ncbi:MAG: trypsin-like peptidase domain-containing protein [Planctomycetota bacterium]
MQRIFPIFIFSLILGLPAACLGQHDVDLAALLKLEKKVTAVAKKVTPATVGIRAGRGLEGSGVIVSADGIVLTAAHVFRRPGDRIDIVMSDGKIHKAKALGKQDRADYGMIKILGKGPFPFVALGKSKGLKRKSICLATGHPGGFQKGRAPVFRLGTIGRTTGPFLQSSCIINSGDSGGPLFDLQGRLIGIHSRIREREDLNYHVPIDSITKNWNRLLDAENWDDGEGEFPPGPYLGVQVSDDPRGCLIDRVYRRTPAFEAGLKVGDIITSIASATTANVAELQRVVRAKEPKDKVVVEIIRGGKNLKKTITLGESR